MGPSLPTPRRRTKVPRHSVVGGYLQMLAQAEALDADDADLSSRGYPVEGTDAYVREPVFAAVVREALRLGYTLVPYESRGELEAERKDLTRQQRRDLEQARNLARGTIDQDPDAKVLVHAGYSHVLESVSERWFPMAVYFREITGIDPVTVDQTRLSERSEAAYEHPAYRACLEAGLLVEAPIVLVDSTAQPVRLADFAVDVQVLGPRTSYPKGRPHRAALGGRRRAVRVEVPEADGQWCFVEARVADEPPEAIRLDGSEVENSDHAWLFVPSEQSVALRVLDAAGRVSRTIPLR